MDNRLPGNAPHSYRDRLRQHGLKGALPGLIFGMSCVLFSAVLRISTLYKPNSLDILGWTSFYFTLIKYFNTQKPKWLFIAALVFAFAFLNKYNIVFCVIGLLPA